MLQYSNTTRGPPRGKERHALYMYCENQKTEELMFEYRIFIFASKSHLDMIKSSEYTHNKIFWRSSKFIRQVRQHFQRILGFKTGHI